MYEIEDNIPVQRVRKSKYPFAELKVGQSFFAPTEGENASVAGTIRSAVKMHAKREHERGNQYDFKTVTEVKDGVAGIRVHRVG